MMDTAERTKFTARQHGAHPRCGDRTLKVFQRLNGNMDIPEQAPRVKTTLASKAQTYLRTHLVGKQRKENPQDNVFVNEPFIEEFSDLMDSPEGELWTEICDALEDLLKDVQLEAKQRQFIWPDADRLDLEQSVQRIHKHIRTSPVTRSRSS